MYWSLQKILLQDNCRSFNVDSSGTEHMVLKPSEKVGFAAYSEAMFYYNSEEMETWVLVTERLIQKKGTVYKCKWRMNL